MGTLMYGAGHVWADVSCQCIGFHSTTSTFPGTCEETPPVPGHFCCPLCDRCFGTPWSAWNRTHFPASDAFLHRGDLLLDIFSTVVWLSLATCWRRTSERNLSVGSLHASVLCFTRFHQVLGWSSCLALSNQQACVRPYCFTGRPRPLGMSFSTGSMVLSFWSAPSSMRFLPYGFLATGSPRLTAFLAPLSPAKLPVSYPFFLSSPCTNFVPTDFCHLRRRSNLLICLFAIFGLNDNVVLFCFNSVTSKCGSWYADCRALCPGPSSQEDRTLAAWSKKNLHRGDRCACPRQHCSKYEPTVQVTKQSKCESARHTSKTYAGLATACSYAGQRQEQSIHFGSGQLHSGNRWGQYCLSATPFESVACHREVQLRFGKTRWYDSGAMQ